MLIIADTLSRAFPEQQLTRILEVTSLDEIPDRNLQIINDVIRHYQKTKNLFEVIQNK